jgi:low temperature requirement protein LtrA
LPSLDVEGERPRSALQPTPQLRAWLELFYDLVFVAAILVLSDAVAHLEPPNRVIWVAAVFVALWCVWLQTTLFTNVFRVQDITHQVLVLAQMFVVILVTMEAHEGVVHDAVALSITYGALIAIVAVMYWRAARAGGQGAHYAATRSYFLLASAIVFGVAAVVPVGRGLVWIIALALSFGPFRWQPRSDADRIPDLDEHHLAERMGALTIIVCGEAFVKVAIVVSQGAIEDVDIVALAFQFVLTFAIWLSYFVDFPEAGFRRSRLTAWTLLHLVVQLGIAASAVGVSEIIRTEPFEHLPATTILAVTAALATVYLALGLLGLCTRRVPVRPLFVLRVSTSVALVVVGMAAWLIPWVDLVEGVAALTVVAVVHAVIGARLDAQTSVPDPA